jgi:hypothetical protein
MANLSSLYMVFINLSLNFESPSFMQVIKIDVFSHCFSLLFCYLLLYLTDYQQQLNFIWFQIVGRYFCLVSLDSSIASYKLYNSVRIIKS